MRPCNEKVVSQNTKGCNYLISTGKGKGNVSKLLAFISHSSPRKRSPETGTCLPRILPPPPNAATFAGEKSKAWSSCLRNSHILGEADSF